VAETVACIADKTPLLLISSPEPILTPPNWMAVATGNW
jgi:hypothetical protein